MRNVIRLVICIMISLPLFGCWDRREINDIAIVTGTSFDMIDDKNYKVATQIPLPGEIGSGSQSGGGGTSGGALFYLDAGVGRNVREANANLQKRMSRKLLFGHRRITVFGETLARDGLRKTLDVLTRTREARLTTQIFVAEGEGITVLAAMPQLENLSSEAVREIGVNTFYLTLKDFLLHFQQKGNDPLLPVLSLVENVSPNPELVAEQIAINKIAVFKQDKLEFITNPKQTSAVRWMLEKMKGEPFTIEWKEGENIVVRIKEQTTNISYAIKNNKPEFEIAIEVVGNLIENETELNFEETGILEQVNKRIEEKVEKEIRSLLDETLSKEIDSFGFGWLLRRRERNKWDDEWKDGWRETLPDLKYEVRVSTTVDLTGLVTQGIGIGE
ncbi:Ger(x)C family spore germination protein [Bacillus solitudinis]|uniref:Ger(x)C family spore germination protein n=1 Tax=Bacillus solitudinis TaxID=2014074 RepID=UPI000C2432D3|nr:Ger(x)C family spore germination protein [Bacillus solitudinis]